MEHEDIEILDFDEEIYPRKKVLIEDNKKGNRRKRNRKITVSEKEINELKNKKKNNEKKDKKLSKGEKIFLIISILFIIGCFVFYGYRTYHYYHETHDIVDNISIKDKLTSLGKVVYQDDGLYEKDGYYYYKGVNVSNYVYYSGRLFRIIDINKGIRMIEDETLTNLVWSINSNYEESNIRKWLIDYLNTLDDYKKYLKTNEWCNEPIDLANYECKKTINDYVGLLSTSNYLQASGKNSYLNNGTYFWTINQDMDNNSLYVNNEGNINNLYKKDDNYLSYGIRPVITLKEEVIVLSGNGTKEDPYIIEELGKALLKDNSIGSYVKYNNDNYRILNVDDNGISLICDGVLEIDKKYDDVIKYLNNDYLKKFNKDELTNVDYNISEYSLSNKYTLNKTNNKKNYVTIPNIGDMFVNEYGGYWLNNYSDSKLGLYYTIDENKMLFADLKGNTNKIRPIIKLKSDTVVSSGLGLKDKPLIIGEEGDDNVKEN